MQTGKGKKAILDEYAKLTGFHRKAGHVYNNCVIKTTKVELPKKRRRSYVPKYGADVISSLVKIWRTFDCMCGQRLVPFIRENMDALADEPCFEITEDIRLKLLEISSATVNKAHRWVKESAENLKSALPYTLKGLDSDNGSEFKNYQMVSWCAENGGTFTPSRSYKKNDNDFVEQKNYSNVHHLVDYFRYEGEVYRLALQNLYDKWNLLVNYFYPSVRILAKERKDAHNSAKTPFRRCMESDRSTATEKRWLIDRKAALHVVQLKREVEEALDIVRRLAKNWC